MLYGRDRERQTIGELLEGARASRSGVLVVRGEAGVGKTALLEDARDRAGDMHVLAARGVESELELPFAGLHQLLRPALELLERLPPPQARALEGALGLTDRTGDDRFLISAATLTLLAEHAERRPVLCLVDDAQWLDEPSAGALLFVARRLAAEGIVLLFSAREGEHRRFEAPGLDELTLQGLDATAAAALVDRASGGGAAPPVRERLLEQARGNPLALLELPGALTPEQLSGALPLPANLPLTRHLERLFLERLRRLPEAAQKLVLLAAVEDTGQIAPVLRAAARLGVDANALASAEEAGLISVEGARIEMRHPLVRSAVYQGSPSGERRAAHLAFAEALDQPGEADQRAWHRAAAVQGPDAEVADALESTAQRARLRAGHGAAASALERAADLSVDAASSARRLVAAAGAAWQAGQTERAAALLDRAHPLVSEPRVRADADHLRGLIGLRRGSLLEASGVLLAGAERIEPTDPGKALEMLVDAASLAGRSGDFARMSQVTEAISRLPRSDDQLQALLSDVVVGVGSLIEGKTVEGVPLILGVLERAGEFDDTRLLSWAATGASTIGDSAREAALLNRAVAVARESAQVDTLVLALETAVSAAIVSDRHTFVPDASEGLRLAREAGLANAASALLAALAWSASLAGDGDQCRANAAEVAQSVRSSALANSHTIAEGAVAVLDLATGRPEETATRLVALTQAPTGVAHPFHVLLLTADLVEAYVRLGRLDEARAAFSPLEAFVAAGAPAWALAFAARCRALLSDDLAAAEPDFAEAARLQREANRPFDRARTELLFGERLRRERRRVDAREHLRLAIELFEAIGAEAWAERARAELRASGETARKRDASTLSQLTPQELQVARFVADGLSNKEVAAQLFLSPRTIDAHLRNVFAKLGITSRTQLARMPLGGGEVAAPGREPAVTAT